MGRKRLSSRTGYQLKGNRAYKLYGHRPIAPGHCQQLMSMRHFCELYGISRFTVYRLIKIHLLVTTKAGGRRFVNIRNGCEETFEHEIWKYRNLRQPHKENKGKPYRLGYEHSTKKGNSLEELPPGTYTKLVDSIPGKTRL